MALDRGCNYLTIIEQPPWKKPLRRGIYMTINGEERTPFAVCVRPSDAATGSCSLFSALPAELQLRVLGFCCPSTLFQLMKVSSGLRKEASKLFWAHQGAYFVVEAYWLLEDGGHAGYTNDDLDFLASVENLQVDDGLAMDLWICPMNVDRTVQDRQDRIADFWNALKKRCPRAKRVIINRTWGPGLGREETHSAPQAVQLLVRSSPPGITTSAFVVEKADLPSPGNQRTMYQLCPDGAWEKTNSGQDWKTVFMPAKPFTGPVGRFYELRHIDTRLWLEQCGMWPSVIEALDRHHFDGGRNIPFFCPGPRCSKSRYFQKAGEWIIQATEAHSGEWQYSDWEESNRNRFIILPKAIRQDFERRSLILEGKREEIRQRLEELREGWDRSSRQERRKIRRTWQEQLQNDPLWETGAETWQSNRLWQDFLQEINQGFIEE